MRLLYIVMLKEEDKEHGVSKGCIGTIVDVLGDGDVFTVEFFDENGDTIMDALMTEYKENQLEIC